MWDKPAPIPRGNRAPAIKTDIQRCYSTMNGPTEHEWSIGILNLTKAEAAMTETFALGLRGRTGPTGSTGPGEMVYYLCERGHRVPIKRDWCDECEARTTYKTPSVNDPAPKPLTAARPGNRFSGLDLDTDGK